MADLLEWQKIRIDRIKKFISDGILTEMIIEDLKELIKDTRRNDDYLNQISMIEGDLKSYHKDSRLGLASMDHLTVTRNRLRERLLSLTNEIERYLKNNQVTIHNTENVVIGSIISGGNVTIGNQPVFSNPLNYTPDMSRDQQPTKKGWTQFSLYIISLREAYQIAVSLENAALIKKGKNLREEIKSDIEVYFNTPNDPGYDFTPTMKKIAEFFREVDEYKELHTKGWKEKIKRTLGVGQDYDALVVCIKIIEENFSPREIAELLELKGDLTANSSQRFRTMVKEVIMNLIN